MKLTITIKQWNELTYDQKNKLDDFGIKKDWQMDIGRAIWFLGDDLMTIDNLNQYEIWQVDMKNEALEPEQFEDKELIDVLWECVKYKLKKYYEI